jgi:purine-cytosine permease-like protein
MPPVLKKIKRIAGVIWILLGPLAIIYLIKTAAGEIARRPALETWIQWIVFIGIFIPIAIGMVIFGYYALSGEYDDAGNNS